MNAAELEQILANAKAMLSFEGMNVDNEMVELARKYLQGELSEKEVLDIIKERATKK